MKQFVKNIEWLFAYFFIFAIIGWIWEVIYKFYRYHVFVNRGMNHLPWLPIYGFGALIILAMYILMKKKNIFKVFFLSAFSGIVLEYFTSWVFQIIFDMRWWNYRNYFLNINGRVCLQSFLFFGLFGLVAFYYIIPYVCKFLDKIQGKCFYIIMPFIILIFISDVVLSSMEPNKGKNITYSTRVDKDK